MQIEKALINDRLHVSKVSWKFRITIIYNFAVIRRNEPVKFAIFLKSSLLFNSFYCLFLLLNKTLRLNNLKTRTATNAKISVFVICVEVIIYLLLCNLHDFTFNYFYHCSVRAVRFMLIFVSDRIGCFFIGNC